MGGGRGQEKFYPCKRGVENVLALLRGGGEGGGHNKS